MSFENDTPWPNSGADSISNLNDSNYFSPSSSRILSLDSSTLTPNPSSTYAPAGAGSNSVTHFDGASIRVVAGSELPGARERRASAMASSLHQSPSSPSASTVIYPPSRSRKAGDSSPSNTVRNLAGSTPGLPRPQSGPLPLTSSSTIVKSSASTHVRPEEVWKEVLKTAYGRDKAFKIIQYTMRVIVMSYARSKFLINRGRGGELVRRLNTAIGHLGITRKTLILFNWLTPLIHIMSPPDTSIPFASFQSKSGSIASLSSPTLLHRFLHAPPPVLLDLLNAIADDIATFWRLGLLGPAIGQRAARWADWFWFSSTLAGLVEAGAERAMVKGMLRELEDRIYHAEMDKTTDLAKIEQHEKELEKLKSQFGWLQVTRIKLLMDLVFVSYDLFKIQRAKDTAKTFTGLMSGLLSAYKMYDSQRNEILKLNS